MTIPPEPNPYGPVAPAGAPGGAFGPVPAQPGQIPGQIPGQGGYPGGAWPGGYPQPPKKSRKGLWIALGSVVGAIVIAGGVLAYYVNDVASKTGTHKIVLPQTFQQMDLDPGNAVGKQLQSGMEQSFSTGDHPWKATPVSGVYLNNDAGTVGVVFGAYGDVVLPKVQLDTFWSGFEKGAGAQGSTFEGRRDFPAGPLGGTLSCEYMKAQTETDTICAWADGSSLVAVMQTDKNQPDGGDLGKAAAAALDLRGTAEVPK